MAPAFKWIRVVAFFSLLVMTTAMAASPVRDAVLPLIGQPFARWSGNMTPAVATLATADIGRTSPIAGDLGRATPLTPLSQPDSFTVSTAASATSSITAADRFDHQASGAVGARQDELTPQQLAALARQSGSRFDLGPWQPGGAGSGSRAGSASLARGGRAGKGEAGGRSQASENRAANGGGGSNNGGSRTPGQGNGAGSGNGPTRQPAPPSTPGEASNVFTEHTNGLPVLTGGGSGAAGGVMTLSAATVAANPEPSTLLLLGTGLAAAAGGLRRRLARR